MNAPMDLAGQRFGKLVAIEKSTNETKGKRGNLITAWICKCDCGTSKDVKSKCLRSGETRSCGCITKPNLAGKQFGRLTVIGLTKDSQENACGVRNWDCLCECGNTTTAPTAFLTSAHTRSCGCLRKDSIAAALTTHNMTHDPSYAVWAGMIARCTKRKNPAWKYYGGRGIKVCDRWLDLANFVEDMGDRPYGTTIDRIDNDGDYTPGNCRWATREQQSNNTRQCKYLIYEGLTLTVTQWARLLGIPRGTLQWRLQKGLPLDQCLNASYDRQGNKP